MSESDNLVLEHLRYIRSAVDRIDKTVAELRVRYGAQGSTGHLEEQYASISRRVDHLDDRLDRLDRIEKRAAGLWPLELVDD